MIFEENHPNFIFNVLKCLITYCLTRFVKVLVGFFNKEKVLVVAFSRHCETSRMFVDSSTL